MPICCGHQSVKEHHFELGDHMNPIWEKAHGTHNHINSQGIMQ